MVTLSEKYSILITRYFEENINDFVLVESKTHGPYFYSEYKKDIIKIIVQGDIGGFEIHVFIDNEKFSLWKYDKSLLNKSTTNEENLSYQLSVLKSLAKSL
tara:strand:+ start:52 stop:354 length:303 start_codon:yes stop_codon:yes gene_type:complete